MGLFSKFRKSKKNSTLLRADTVVFIVGPASSEKSRFLSAFLQNEKVHSRANKGRRTRTTMVNVARCHFGEMQNDVVVVDTPSKGPDAEETMKQWMGSNYTGPYEAAGILYMHNITSDQYDASSEVSRHLEAFGCTCHHKLAPRTVHVVPTVSSGANLSAEVISTSMTKLRRRAEDVGASMFRMPFDGRPELAWEVVQELLNNLKERGHWSWDEKKAGLQKQQQAALEKENTETPETKKEAVEKHVAVSENTLLGHPDYYSSSTTLVDSSERPNKEWNNADLGSMITSQRPTSPGQQEHLVCPANLANVLNQLSRMEGAVEDLAEITYNMHAALGFLSPSHLELRSSLLHSANYLYRRFWREGDVDDLATIYALRRDAQKLIPSRRSKWATLLVSVKNVLHQIFGKEDTVMNWTEIITPRHVPLQFLSPGFGGGSQSLTDLQEIISLRRAKYHWKEYQKLGVVAELDKAIALANDALARCPPEDSAPTREFLATCIELKVQQNGTVAHPSGLMASIPCSSDVKQIIWNIVDDTMKTIPLRLLHTQSGVLCNRDAQISRFKHSAEYNELLSLSAGTHIGQDLEERIRRTVSDFFQYVTLSHIWRNGELLLCDIKNASIYDLSRTDGVAKLQNFCILALKRGFLWAWSDTCCIDKDSSAELQEAIGSMFLWYRRSALTIVHLSDVANTVSFIDSVWFRRGWTLQELLASPTVLFYLQDWSLYADRGSSNHKTDSIVLEDLRKASGIEEAYLQNFRPGMDNARSRLQWASSRRTTRPEDIAYSLFGVFDLHLPVLYGESADKALGRLLAEIVSQSGDVSVLDWVGKASSFHSCFPASLTPYQEAPCTLSAPTQPSRRDGVDIQSVRKLYSSLAKLPRPRFIGRRLVLPSIVHPVTAVKLINTLESSRHVYEIHASGLMPLQLTSSDSLQEGLGADLPFVLIRPWHPKWLDLPVHEDAAWRLLERLEQPFHALLLKELLHNEYERIACDCLITAQVQDLASIVSSELQIPEIV
ncbi:hypothetical protein EDC04DRAFT_3140533 [Pisolithus marmoratus]|nr:hypothetical protein EDC04DRAFT_3140533 [Pisolithus marmoratus]